MGGRDICVNMITLPGEKRKWFQTNRSKILGNLWATFNIDLQSNLGLLKGSPRLRTVTATADLAALSTTPSAFRYFDTRFFSIVGLNILRSASSTAVSGFAVDTSTATPTTNSIGSDLEIFNGALFASTGNELWSLNAGAGGTWTRRGGATPLNSGSLHLLTYFKKFNRLYVLDANDNVLSMSTGYSLATSGDYTLDLGVANLQLRLTCIRATSETIWLGAGTYLDNTGAGRIFAWDGISAQPSHEYVIKGSAIAAMTVIDDVPYAIDSNGTLFQFTGASFEEIGRLPSDKLHNLAVFDSLGVVHPNGLIGTRNGTILALVNNRNTDTIGTTTINENLPSGVWEWSRDYGFTHKHSVSYNSISDSTITDYGQNKLSSVGALFSQNTTVAGDNGSLMLGATYFTSSTAAASSAIFIDDSNDIVQKFSYFVTTWISSANLLEKWRKIAVKYRQLLASTDRITVKYRLREAAPTYITITWVNTTSFTTTTDVSAMVGYEVEILQGTGSGKCAHITGVTGSGTYTVTIDEAVTGVTTGTAKARTQAWKKLFQVGDQTTESQIRNLEASSERIQLKVTMLFTGENEFNDLIVVDAPGTLLV